MTNRDEQTAQKRPWRHRVWFYRPGAYLSWKPISRGGDEWDWHTVVIGLPIFGQVVIAMRPCDYTGDCAEMLDLYNERPDVYRRPEWPVDGYGNDHSNKWWHEASVWQDAHDEICPDKRACARHENYWATA